MLQLGHMEVVLVKQRVLKFENNSIVSVPTEESLEATAHVVFTEEQVKAIELIIQKYLKATPSQK